MHSSSMYDFTVKDASGQDYNLGQQLKDKKAVLVVNVASQCTYAGGKKGGRRRRIFAFFVGAYYSCMHQDPRRTTSQKAPS